MTLYKVQYLFGIIKYFLILDAYNAYALFLQKGSSFRITQHSFFGKMTGPVQFNGQFFFVAIKIKNIIANTKLPPEFPAL